MWTARWRATSNRWWNFYDSTRSHPISEKTCLGGRLSPCRLDTAIGLRSYTDNPAFGCDSYIQPILSLQNCGGELSSIWKMLNMWPVASASPPERCRRLQQPLSLFHRKIRRSFFSARQSRYFVRGWSDSLVHFHKCDEKVSSDGVGGRR